MKNESLSRKQREYSDDSLWRDRRAVGQLPTPKKRRPARHAQLAEPAGGDMNDEQQKELLVRSVGERSDTLAPPSADGAGRLLWKVVRACAARLLFALHSMTTVWQVVEVENRPGYWSFALISVAILIEGAYTVIGRAGDERRWFCPCVLLYIIGTAPPIWALELDLSKKRYELLKNHSAGLSVSAHVVVYYNKETDVEKELGIDHELWVQVLEQLLLVFLIVGRWLLPKGEITREQLSQILLAYLAIASDIVELFDVFKEPQITKNWRLQYAILSCWTLSLLQFPFVLTISRARKMRVAITQSTSDEELRRIAYRQRLQRRRRRRPTSTWIQVLRDVDIWAILLANCLQDVPFLFLRIYLLFGYKIVTYTMIFFSCKNLLIILLQTYRAVILIYERYEKPTRDEERRRLVQHYQRMLHHCREALDHLFDEQFVSPNKRPPPSAPSAPRPSSLLNLENGHGHVRRRRLSKSPSSVRTATAARRDDGDEQSQTSRDDSESTATGKGGGGGRRRGRLDQQQDGSAGQRRGGQSQQQQQQSGRAAAAEMKRLVRSPSEKSDPGRLEGREVFFTAAENRRKKQIRDSKIEQRSAST